MTNNKIPAFLEVALTGTNLLEASAGTGKTFTVALLYLRALLGIGTPNDKPLEVKKILVVTFTNAATEELISRIRHRITEAITYVDTPGDDQSLKDVLNVAYELRNKEECQRLLMTALSQISFAHISTIHRYCANICSSVAIDSGLPLNLTLSIEGGLVEQSIKDIWRQNILLDDYNYKELISTYSNHQSIYKKALAKNLDRVHVASDEILRNDLLTHRPERAEITALFSQHNALFKAPYNKDDKIESMLDMLYDVEGDSILISPKVVKFFAKSNLVNSTVYKAKVDEKSQQSYIGMVDKFPLFELFDPFAKTRKRTIQLVDYNFFYQSHNQLKTRIKRLENANGEVHADRLIQLAADMSKIPRVAQLMRENLPLAIIDEFQDTDSFQYELFKNIYSAGKCGLLMVGDPKQAIYAFRGGDIHTYLKAKQDVNHTYDLENNFRSAKAVVEGINAIFSRVKDGHAHASKGPFKQEDIPFLSVSAKADKQLLQIVETNGWQSLNAIHGEYLPDNYNCSLTSYARQTLVAISSANYAAKLLSLSIQGKCFKAGSEGTTNEQQSLKKGDVAFLVNSHSEAKLIKNALAQKGIPSLTQSRESIYQEQEAYDCWLLLRSFLAPTNHKYFEQAMLADINALGYQKVYSIINNESMLQTWIAAIHELNSILLEQGPMVAINRWFNQIGANESFMQLSNDRKATNVMQLLELLQEDFAMFGGGQKLLTRFERAISSHELADEKLLRLESDEDRVKIITIHTSKGLEYPVVFVPFAWRDSASVFDQLYSAHDDNGNPQLGFSKELKNKQKLELQEEKLRLFYVALTRASQHLVLHFIDSQTPIGKEPSKGYNQSPLGWYFPVNNDEDIVRKAFDDFQRTLEPINHGCISLEDIHVKINDVVENSQLEILERKGNDFNGRIDGFIGTSSFSALTKGYSVDLKDADEENSDNEASVGNTSSVVATGRHALAKGAHIGTALHNVLEHTNFIDWNKDSVLPAQQALLQRTNYELKSNGVLYKESDLEQLSPEYSKWLEEVIETPFLNINKSSSENQAIALKDLEQWIPELTFTFKLSKYFGKSGLRDLLKQHGYNLEGLSGNTIHGMLTGAIDLVFEHDQKYYLADYKSNYLGVDYQAYNVENLGYNNDKKAYTLQYLIYTLALHKHLKTRLSNYTYETHFGGAFYLYLRGMHPDINYRGKGIFFHTPSIKVIKALDSYFCTETEQSKGEVS